MAGGRDIIRHDVLNKRSRESERQAAIKADEKARTKRERKVEGKMRPSQRRRAQTSRQRPPIEIPKARRQGHSDKMDRGGRTQDKGNSVDPLAGVKFATPEARQAAEAHGMTAEFLLDWAPADIDAGFTVEDVDEIHAAESQ